MFIQEESVGTRLTITLDVRDVAVAALLSALLVAPGAVAQDEEAPPFRVEYSGEVVAEGVGEGMTPLSGIFTLTFKLYPERESTDHDWLETHYLSVLEGEYTVVLGSEVALEDGWRNEQRFLGVEYAGTEIVRVPVTLVPFVPPTPPPTPATPDGGLATTPPPANLTEVTFAQLADRALIAQEAERAQEADSVQGRTWEDIESALDRSAEQLAQHAADPNAHGQRRITLGSQTVLEAVGGDGGVRYTRMCPGGYVMVGIRGGAGGFVDSIEPVCAQLE